MKLSTNATSDVVIDGKQYDTFSEPPVALAKERAAVTFPIRELTYYFGGGKEQTEATEALMNRIERDPLFNTSRFYDWDKEEIREITFKHVGRIYEYLDNLGVETHRTREFLSSFGMVNPSAGTRISVHYGLFVNAIRGQGTTKQYEYWKSRGAISLSKFYGCFGMTELGHGSNVAGMETTAIFDPNTDEFIINTPTVAASKWWIGGAAHSANHTLCFARLIVKGKDYGVYSFVVPLRDIETHNLLPGIALGDIGKKMGRDGIDNGWIQFTNVRIPRNYLLMRYIQVTPEGEVIEPPMAQLAYGALINGRVSMGYDSWVWARRFLVIAIRYAAARRQFTASPDAPETKLLDYTYHQRRLMPLLAHAIAIEAAASEVYRMYLENDHLQQTVDPNDSKALAKIVSSAKALFVLSAGVKAFSTWATATIIDECRQACGGHGYSGYNGFGQGYNDWVVNCTWEGDNNVLCLSTGRALIQDAAGVLKGKPAVGASSYLNDAEKLKGAKLGSRDITDPAVMLEGWHFVAASVIFSAARRYVDLVHTKKLRPAEAYEQLSSERMLAARLHTRAFQIEAFMHRIKAANPAIQPVLTRVWRLFALSQLEKEAASFLQTGFITATDLDKVTLLVDSACLEVRKEAVGIVDSFNLSDYFINAPIGNYSGDVYKNYFAKVCSNNPPDDAIAPYYEKLQKPFFKRVEADIPPLDEI